MEKRKILVVDDDRLVRLSLKRALTLQGYDVVLSENADEAIGEVLRGRFDLVVSDIRMPNKNGVETIKCLREIFAKHNQGDVPIIFITGYADDSLMLNADHLGEIILKPFDLERLILTIREYL